ncbi:MAG: protein transport protein YOS1 [Amphiamblys sp. WSBS2006]|nr:MAG: protein transport protein YOS1 [Amphiamblys sp. WSBS2006]
MGSTLFRILLSSVLLLNSVTILNEKRFLVRCGLKRDPAQKTTIGNVANMIYSIQIVLRIPLIFINVFLVVICLIFG